MFVPSSVLAEVSDKVVQVSTFWIIGAIGAAVAAVARRHRWARGATTAGAVAWVALNVLNVVTPDDGPIGREIVIEMGWSYPAHQVAAALLPLAVALVPVRGGGRNQAKKNFPLSS